MVALDGNSIAGGSRRGLRCDLIEVERMGLVVVDPDWEPDFDDIGD
jgi:hypothetical protein